MSRTIFVGDVHGCLHELQDLLDACAHAEGDRVILAGDLVAKGPDSAGVLRLFDRLHALGVRGNHDHAVLRWRETVRSRVVPDRVTQHLAVAQRLTLEEWAVLERLPLYLPVPDHNAIVVHGGIVPGIPIELQEQDTLLNMRTLRRDGTGSRRPDDGVLWGSAWPGPELIVFGHHAMAGLQRHPHALGLDTGCVYGGRLTAYVLPEDRLVSVPARSVYANADTDRKSHV